MEEALFPLWQQQQTLDSYKFRLFLTPSGASLIAQLVKNLPAVQETLVRFLGQKDLLEKGQATHSRILGHPLRLSW